VRLETRELPGLLFGSSNEIFNESFHSPGVYSTKPEQVLSGNLNNRVSSTCQIIDMASATKPSELPIAEEVSEPGNPEFVPVVYPRRGLVRRGIVRVGSVINWLFGLTSLWIGLAVLASVPLFNFLTLGYLLEASGRVARSGRLRDGFIGVRTAARFGGIAVGGFLFWLPLYGMSYMAERAQIIDTTGRIAWKWETWLIVLTVLYVLHVVATCLRDGRLRSFFWPLNSLWLLRRSFNENVLKTARDTLWNNLAALHLPYYFWLGVRGFVGAFLWLIVPLALLGQGHRVIALGVLGGFLLGLVVLYLPFLQTRFARDNHLRAFIQLRAVRRDFRCAPIAFAIALTIHLAFAIPLYVLKIEVIPRDLMYLEGLIFIAFIFPARLLDGWAYSRATRRNCPCYWLFRWASRLSVLPVIAAYVLAVFASQHLGWYGVSSLFEQHAFLLPTPFTK
jgi:hypothetical protein